jgi:hypothetical protein
MEGGVMPKSVLIVDYLEGRRKNLKKKIGEIKCEACGKAPKELPESTRVVFLHASDERQSEWRQFSNKCQNAYLVLYSGGVIDATYLNRKDPIVTLKGNWFLLEGNPVDENADAGKGWFPKAFVDAVESGVSDHDELLAILTGFDPVLEAKLNLLYACLEGGSVLGNFKRSDEWKLVASLKVGKQSVGEFLNSVQGKSIPPETLKTLRDALLPEYPELQPPSNS